MIIVDYDNLKQTFKDSITKSINNRNTKNIGAVIAYHISMNNVDHISYILDCLNVPDNLTLKERICYYQLLED